MWSDRFGTALHERFAGLQTELSQFVVITLAVRIQQHHDSVDVVAETVTGVTTADGQENSQINKPKELRRFFASDLTYQMEARHWMYVLMAPGFSDLCRPSSRCSTT